MEQSGLLRMGAGRPRNPLQPWRRKKRNVTLRGQQSPLLGYRGSCTRAGPGSQGCGKSGASVVLRSSGSESQEELDTCLPDSLPSFYPDETRGLFSFNPVLERPIAKTAWRAFEASDKRPGGYSGLNWEEHKLPIPTLTKEQIDAHEHLHIDSRGLWAVESSPRALGRSGIEVDNEQGDKVELWRSYHPEPRGHTALLVNSRLPVAKAARLPTPAWRKEKEKHS
ncbi:hypothetical protein EYF80_014854 [Liparis tanakae]|uniref:Uncharacterized protein n=1 Tax=Liparis tanakae TaxID=230148 RepID=A0A4Z2IA78_9TELE|nr:hypothetical protein EYF80_014854 [Liparis tanakae]